MKRRSRSERLAEEIFGLVEYDQGKGFVSEGMGVLTPKEIVETVRTALWHTEVAGRKMQQWLQDHKGIK